MPLSLGLLDQNEEEQPRKRENRYSSLTASHKLQHQNIAFLVVMAAISLWHLMWLFCMPRLLVWITTTKCSHENEKKHYLVSAAAQQPQEQNVDFLVFVTTVQFP